MSFANKIRFPTLQLIIKSFEILFDLMQKSIKLTKQW